MDQFKPEEMKAMELGGNQKAREWMEGKGLDMSLKPQEKYNTLASYDYKNYLNSLVTNTEYVPLKEVPVSSNRSSDKDESVPTSNRKEAYFSSLGKVNESRPENLPPSKGGKYAGFGNTASSSQPHENSAASVFDNFPNDPLGSLTKGWGIFSKTVSTGLAQVNETYIKPSVKNLAEGDVGQQTRNAMAQFGSKVQETSRLATETFSSLAQNNSQTRTLNNSQYGKLFDGLGEEPLLRTDSPIPPAFGLSRPKEHTALEGIENPEVKKNKKSDWGNDDW